MLSFTKSACLVLKHLQRKNLASCLCAIIKWGSEGGFLLFVYEKNAPAFLLLHGFLLVQKKQYSISHKIKKTFGKIGSNLGQFFHVFVY